MSDDLLLLNANVITTDPTQPRARAIATRGERIVAVGSEAAAQAAALPGARVIDCRGRTLVPGFVDAHVHLAAYAASLRSVDCSPVRARSIADIIELVGERARSLPPGAWVRAAGYDESALSEGRHPSRWDLDAAAPDHPVRLLHRSGHAGVLNSRALALAGISMTSEEPPGGVIDRRLVDGEPTGLLLEMNDIISRAVPPLPRAELVAGMRAAGERLLAAGVTAVQDMTHTNGPDAAAFLAGLTAESRFAPRLLPVADGWDAAGPGTAGDRPVKVMVRELGERPIPDTAELAGIIRACATRGRQVAVHAVERRTVAAVVAAFEEAGATGRTPELRHRIEHAGVCPPDLAERIAALGLVAVSNPGFLYHGGERYRRRVAPRDLPHLYAAGALHAAGVRLAAGSDTPVVPSEPLRGIAAAATRRTAAGMLLPGLTLAPHEALAMHTTGAAYAAHAEHELGRIAPGMRADLALLSGDPSAEGTHVEMTIIGGVQTYPGPAGAAPHRSHPLP